MRLFGETKHWGGTFQRPYGLSPRSALTRTYVRTYHQRMTPQSELLPTLDADIVPTTLQPRLFKATGARVLPNVEWVEIQVKSVLNRVQGMPFKWSINPYRGCSHSCVFCYARRTHWFLDQDGVNGWGSRIFVKVNAPEVLRRELAQRSWTREE